MNRIIALIYRSYFSDVIEREILKKCWHHVLSNRDCQGCQWDLNDSIEIWQLRTRVRWGAREEHQGKDGNPGLPRGRLSSMTIRFASDLLSWLHSLFQDKWHDPRPGCRLLYIAHKGDHLSLFLSFSFPLFFLSGVLTQLVRSRCHFEKVCKEEKANPDGEELPSLEPRAIR